MPSNLDLLPCSKLSVISHSIAFTFRAVFNEVDIALGITTALYSHRVKFTCVPSKPKAFSQVSVTRCLAVNTT